MYNKKLKSIKYNLELIICLFRSKFHKYDSKWMMNLKQLIKYLILFANKN